MIPQVTRIRREAPSARATHNTTQSTTSGESAVIALNTEAFDNDVIHDTVTNNSRMTCRTAGLYQIAAILGWAANATGLRQASIQLNGTTHIAMDTRNSVGASVPLRQSLSTAYRLAVGDYVELIGYQDSGGALLTENQAWSPILGITFFGL